MTNKSNEKIEWLLQELQNQINNPENNNDVYIDGILTVMRNMAKNVASDGGQVFKDVFLDCLQIMTALNGDLTEESNEYTISLNNIICELCYKIAHDATFVDRLLCTWLQYLDSLPDLVKWQAFKKFDIDLLKHCAHLVVHGRSFSSQLRMFSIMCTFSSCTDDSTSMLCESFSGLETDQVELAIKSADFLVNGMDFDHQNYVVHRTKSKHYVSEMITSVAFDEQTPITLSQNDGWLHFNKELKIIEFWITHDLEPILVTIMAQQLKTVEIVGPENISIQTLRFGLNSPSIFEIYSGENVQIPDYNAKTIIVTFAGVGVDRSRYELLFRNKYRIELQRESETEVCTGNGIVELPTDQRDKEELLSGPQPPFNEDGADELVDNKVQLKPVRKARKRPAVSIELISCKRSQTTRPKREPKQNRRRSAAVNAEKNIRSYYNRIKTYKKLQSRQQKMKHPKLKAICADSNGLWLMKDQ